MIPRFLKLPTIASQIILLVLGSEIAFQAITAIDVHVIDGGQPGRCDSSEGNGFSYAVRLMDDMTDQQQRDLQLQAIKRTFPRMGVSVLPADMTVRAPMEDAPEIKSVQRILGPDRQVFFPREADAPTGRIVIRLSDKTLIAATVRCRNQPAVWAWDTFIRGFFYILLTTPFLLWWSRRTLAHPLQQVEEAANSFALDRETAPIPATGPTEIRAATTALNRAVSRVRKLVAERSRMLAAVSHDLMTPLTRLQMRCDFVKDDKVRQDMVRDIEQMRAMVEQALSFLREGRGTQRRAAVDLPTLLTTVRDQFLDLGHEVDYIGPRHLAAEVDPQGIERAITNLVGNAIKFGDTVVISLNALGGLITIEVADNGPGIPDSEKDRVTEPFMRGDEARTIHDDTGFGLGLSIVKAVAEQHEGKLSLHDREPHGLLARMEFPHKIAQTRNGPRPWPARDAQTA